MTRPMPGPPEKYQLLGPMVIVWEGGNGYYYHPSLMDAKRLTDAECAAEYWRAEAGKRARSYTGPDPEFLDVEDSFTYAIIRHTWHRFATRPHVLEEA